MEGHCSSVSIWFVLFQIQPAAIGNTSINAICGFSGIVHAVGAVVLVVIDQVNQLSCTAQHP